ncbi:hypothetical protein OB920_07690 [Halobacteria archaeon HArc-gm2]|nr:hypothetical protein [Halobacteria archaeon HArc-gm2]
MPNWKDDLSARERVRQIVETVTDPVSANWVKDQAGVGWQTAKNELEQLADRGDLRRVDQDGDVRYVPDFTRLYTERVRELAVEFSRGDLRDEVVQAKEDIEAIETEYGVDGKDELEASLSDEDVSAAATRERKKALREWEEITDEMQLLEHALALYEDLHDVDPYVEQGGPDGGESADVGSFETRVA